MIVFFLSLGLLFSGTMSTMSAKAADKQGFDHPYVQVLFMFLGEFLCLAITPFMARCRGATAARTEDAEALIVGQHDAGFETRAEKAISNNDQSDVLAEATNEGYDAFVDTIESQSDNMTREPLFSTSPSGHQFPLNSQLPASSTLSEFPAPTSPASIIADSTTTNSANLQSMNRAGVFQSNLSQLEPAPSPIKHVDEVNESDAAFQLGIPLWKFAVPALLDVVGSTLIFLGIQKTTASQFQLMRSALVPFTSFVSFLVFKKVPRSFQFLGISFIVLGIALVSHGAKSASEAPFAPADDGDTLLWFEFNVFDRVGDEVHEYDKEDEFLGNMYVLMAQLVIAFMLVWEEKMYQNVNSLVAVGLEGMFGIFFTCGLIFVLQFIDDSSKPYGKMESIHAAFDEISKDLNLAGLLLLNTIAVSLLNSIGVALMVRASAAHRTVIDTLRIVFIWVASIAVGWEKTVSLVQLASFALLVIGIAVYNKIVRIPFFNYEEIAYHHHEPLQEPLLVEPGQGVQHDDRQGRRSA